MDILLALLLGLYLLIAPALGIAAFSWSRQHRDELARLRRQVQGMALQIDDLRTAGGAPVGERGEAPEAPPEEAPSPAAPEAPVQPEPPEPAAAPEPASERTAAPPPRPAVPAAAAGPQVVRQPAAARPSLEQWLTSRGLIWLGGGTAALAAVFLVKYSIERGWIGPVVRVSLGFVFGLALVLGGEWLRRRPLQRAIAAIGPNYLPPALTAAGLFAAFASVYAAYGLYDLLPAFLAFALLAAIAFAAFGMALLQGPLIAVLGLLGGFATPFLVSTGTPLPWPLFGYLLVLVGGSLAIVRVMAWWWLAWGTLAGAVLWPLLWFAGIWTPGDAVPLGIYLVLLSALYLGVRHGRGASVELVTWKQWFVPLALPEQLAWGAAAAVSVLVFILVRTDGYGPASLGVLVALACLYLAAGYRESVFDALAIVAAALTVALIALWHLPQIVTGPLPLHEYLGQEYSGTVGPVLPPELSAFVVAALIFGALFALAGFLALGGSRRPAIWAGVSAATPLALLAVAYWRIVDFGLDLKWSAVAVALAGLNVVAAGWIRRRPLPRHGDLALAAYAAATVASLSLAFAMALEQAWLTVALSLQLPALAWIHDRLSVKPLRHVALVLAGVVLARLVLNYNVLDYPLGGLPGFNWVLYGYGIPAIAFWWAASRFRRSADDLLVMVLEAGTLAFIWLFVTLEIRTLVAGSLTAPRYDLAEQSLQTIAWLALAYGWLRLYRHSGRRPLLWGWRLLAGLAALHTPLFQLLASNPLWSADPVGNWPVVNLLSLAYLAPAVFAFLFAWELRRTGHQRAAMAAAVYGLVLVFVYLSLEVRRAFHGPVLGVGSTGDAEFYSYSVVWLCYALVVLGLGIWKGLSSLRYASLAVLFVVVGKVLLFDTAELSDFLRVLSVAGLALGLFGIVYFYQRFVFPPRAPGTGQAPGRPAAMS
jgi:uncharacterized membrane protein